MPHSKPFRFACFAILVLAAGGCQSVSKMVSKTPPKPCPAATIISDASRLVSFRPGPGRDITDIAYEARLPRITVSCDHQENLVEVTTTVSIVAARGPANTDRRAPIRYFVAVLDGKDRVLAKEEFQTRLQFPVNADRGTTSEELVQRIPLAKGVPATAYLIAVGFQLSRDELAFNRENRSLTLLGGRRPRAPESGFDGLIGSDYEEGLSPSEVQQKYER